MDQKLDYLILKDKSLIIEYYKGKYNVDELINFKIEVGKDKDYNPSYNVIHDFRDLEFMLEIEEVSKYVKLLTENKNYIGKRKSTMLTETPNQVTASLGFKLLKKDLPISVKVCSTMETAFNFINLPNNDWDLVESLIKKLRNTI